MPLLQCVKGNYIEIVSDEGRRVYSGINSRGDFKVSEHFTFKALNESNKFVLTLEVRDGITNEIIMTDQAGQYGVVTASN